jgi:4-hydroxybenzoate polyprenyltransferase
MTNSAIIPPTPSRRQLWLEFADSIKIQHTVFALPFALLAGGVAVVLEKAPLTWSIAMLVLACCVMARTAAMTFNRYIDADIDAKNPRTANRSVPAGRLSPQFMVWSTVVCSGGFLYCAAMINFTTAILSPVALAVVLGYSLTKRFTALCHFILGLALALAPAGAYIAVTGSLSPPIILLSLGVLFWTAGFDMIYACQDEEFDRENGLNSIPARMGMKTTLVISQALHVLCLAAFVFAGVIGQFQSGYFLGSGLVAVLLVAQHLVVLRLGPQGIPMAFFTINGWTGIVLMTTTFLGWWLAGIPL